MKPDELQILVKDAEAEVTETNFPDWAGPSNHAASFTAKQQLRGMIWSQDWKPAQIADLHAFAGIVQLKPLNHKTLN